MRCPDLNDIVRSVDGELSFNRHAVLAAHFDTCASCKRKREEIAALVRRTGPDAGEFDDPALVGEILARVRAADPAPTSGDRRRAAWRWRIALPAVAAMATLGLATLLLFRPTATNGIGALEQPPPRVRGAASEFTARGSAKSNPERWVALWLFRQSGDGEYQRVEQKIDADTHLAFGYLNAKGAYRYLMIYALDERGELFWYYPSVNEGATEQAKSIAIADGRQQLGHEVQHDLAAGRLRVSAIFSNQPLRAAKIARMVEQQWAKTPDLNTFGRLPLAGLAQVSHIVDVKRSGR